MDNETDWYSVASEAEGLLNEVSLFVYRINTTSAKILALRYCGDISDGESAFNKVQAVRLDLDNILGTAKGVAKEVNTYFEAYYKISPLKPIKQERLNFGFSRDE